MGFVRKTFGIDLTGGGVSDAAGHAARLQAGAAQEGLRQFREDVDPFRQIGTEAANLLLSNVFGQTAGAEEEVLQNPFFRALAQQQEQDILSQRAALGLAGSGGTQDALQRNLLQLGEGFLMNRNQQRFNQLFNIAGMGANAAAMTGTQALNTQNQLGQLAGLPGQIQAQQRSNLGQQMIQLGILGAATGGFGLLGGGAAAGAIGAGAPVGQQVFGLGNLGGGGATGALSTFGL